ncbi:hypothetical protein ABIC28_003094 [Rhodococcus sp. PvR044]|jgi:hypothetical protein|uniref:hypothetical protein n=1 Tax=Rhodococcus TaxID=1827 RepID=UPI000BD29E1E|nr:MULTISPECIES: hypothetical protein [Rhodococcus]MCZ4555093.1 hypothetical protein [Rhodococcus maanshanensis]PTR45119.1 hypothetical protein C8K38_102259 [Rhodococcus sp. OK611]SNX89454.1 hypothetical protein SAMN05447004_102259 [Rhodococcus sp. OK270]
MTTQQRLRRRMPARSATVGALLLALVAAPVTVALADEAPPVAESPGSTQVLDGTGSGDMWAVPTLPADQLTLIIAFSFGNRMPAGADPARTEGEPGPVNEALADTVVAARGDRDIPVYAQTPIADVLRTKYDMDDVVAIAADVRPDGTLAYLSTDGAAAKVAALRGASQATDLAGVVAFGDHQWRATRTAEANGFRAYAPLGISMPTQYDPESGQVWTRSREVYLPTDYAGRIPLLIETGSGAGR